MLYGASNIPRHVAYATQRLKTGLHSKNFGSKLFLNRSFFCCMEWIATSLTLLAMTFLVVCSLSPYTMPFIKILLLYLRDFQPLMNPYQRGSSRGCAPRLSPSGHPSHHPLRIALPCPCRAYALSGLRVSLAYKAFLLAQLFCSHCLP